MRFNKKEKWMAFTLLAVPLALTITLMFPHYEKFIAPGHIVKIEELGIKGHVYMTYVEGGVARNYLEKLLITFHYDREQVSFEPASRDESSNNEELQNEEEISKETVVTNALQVSGYSVDSSQSVNSKYASIMEKSAQYVGNSFGLMAGIGLVEEESLEDFSRGGKYTIAGTGTLEQDGTVGSVGGIREKVETAAQSGVDYFFVPKDKGSFPFGVVSNQEEAEQYAKEHSLHLQIIPVETLEEALSFLKNLP
ncbi:S16 family serine protease [Brevibacillus ginsengisoli]|uniref:S16 family serine protease n=1 Tax=Brevibacillus ginsengisoli TaxID=363854 RepID=UPI003CF4D784